MKIGLVTCHNIKNYGSVYQTLATQSILEDLGHEVQVIDYRRKGTDHKEFRQLTLSESHMAKKAIIGKFVPLILYPSFIKMENVFESFLNNYIKRTKNIYHSSEELKNNLPDMDLFITGSDQVWNSSINLRIEKTYFLDFVPDSKPRISISSSFGKKEISAEEEKVIKPLLMKYSHISTREKTGVQILNKMGIQGGYASMDPTLIVNRNLWDRIKKPIKTPKKYILVYQLHRNKEFDEYIKRLSKYYNMPCIRITLYYHYALKGEKVIVTPTPNQLLTLVENANYVISDSFHMTVFSIIFHKKFAAIFSKNSFNGRIENLLDMTNLKNRIVNENTPYDKLDENINYAIVDEIITKKQNEALEWIKQSIGDIGGKFL